MVRPVFSIFVALLAIIGFASRCRATTYTVGDTSGWDISTNIDSWAKDKHFAVGDVLLFQYSSSHSVEEVNRESYDRCNTTNVLQRPSSNNGNTSFALTKPGNRYFICGNKLHCYAGMKLHVVVDGKTADGPPAPAPEAEAEADVGGGSTSSSTPTTTTITSTPSSKKNNPSSIVPSSTMCVTIGRFKSFVSVGFISCLLAWMI